MQIFCKNLIGKTIVITIEPTDTIESLRDIIYDKEKIPPKYQRIIFEGKQLENNHTIADYNIQKDITVHLFIRFI